MSFELFEPGDFTEEGRDFPFLNVGIRHKYYGHGLYIVIFGYGFSILINK